MLKIFLVEDEFVVRQGIKKNIDWLSHEYEFCGEASDGELAFPMIQKLKPDIVITDIHMPFMDGLSLSKLIKKEMPWIEIIILTGYEEFEYAKEAINIGVAQYITKPINGEDLLKKVDALAEKIEQKRQEQEIKEKYMKEMEENITNDRKVLFQYLVTGLKSMADLWEIAGKLEIDLSAMWYNIILLNMQSMHHAHDEFSNSLIEIEQKIKLFDDDKRLLIFDRNLEGKAIIFKADSKEEIENVQEEYINKITEILKEYSNVRYFGGIGVPVNRLSELPISFERASHAFAHRYLVNESRIINSDAIKQSEYTEQEDVDINDINLKHLDRAKIEEFLKVGNREEVIYFVEEFFKDLGSSAMKSRMLRQYIVIDAYVCVLDFLESLQIQKQEIEPLDIASGVLQNEETAMSYIVKIFSRALELREKRASNRYGDVVEEIKSYIEKNYADEELSLNILASHVNFSPNHLSMIFSQQTGKTFIKYLTDYRMNKAKELLRCTGKKSSNISIEVGYKDPHYFSYLFKKTQGMTPTQYRGGKNVEGED